MQYPVQFPSSVSLPHIPASSPLSSCTCNDEYHTESFLYILPPLALSYVLLSSIECLAPPSTPAVSTWATAADVGYVWSGQPVDLFLAKHRHIRLIQIFTRLLIISLGLAIAASSSPFKCVVRTHPSSY